MIHWGWVIFIGFICFVAGMFVSALVNVSREDACDEVDESEDE